MKYSFIVPVYGCACYLEKCVSSILAQKGNHELEIILVDDGSKDGSGCIADELAAREPRVRTFHKENGGAASARNFGLQKAAGQYILFIDGDDTVEDQLLNSVDAVLKKDPNVLIIFGLAFDYYREDTCVRTQVLSCAHENGVSVETLLENYRSYFYDNALSSACNKVFAAQIIRDHTLQMKEDMTLYEDYEFVLRYLSCVDSVCFVPEALYHYRNMLEDNHLNRRVEDIDRLRRNACQLMQTSLSLGADSIQLREVSANLYLMLLWQHLKVKKYTAQELADCVLAYCNNSDFRAVLVPDVKLGELEGKLLTQIDEGKFRDVLREVNHRKRAAIVKGGIKKLLKAVGVKGY